MPLALCRRRGPRAGAGSPGVTTSKVSGKGRTRVGTSPAGYGGRVAVGVCDKFYRSVERGLEVWG